MTHDTRSSAAPGHPKARPPLLRQRDRHDRLEKHARSIRVEWLPPYTPDLNPVEHVWGHTKYSYLANFAPVDLEDLQAAVVTSLVRTRSVISSPGSSAQPGWTCDLLHYLGNSN